MPKIVDYEERKFHIAGQAMTVFSEKGYFNTSLEDLSVSCNMGRTTLYKYFRNKDEIYFYILELGMTFYRIKYDETNKDNSMTYIEKIASQLEFLIMSLNGQSVSKAFLDFWLMVRHNHSEIEDKMVKRYNEIIDGISYWLQKGVDCGQITPIDTNSTAVIILGMVEAISLQELSKKSLDPKSAYDSVVTLINGLRVC
ncbi:MAG: TetR/AcrR family transcriptional regulator [Dethiosulfatibacter sp.]|nr:TetR/AcrR family transcriptional regulator [Dethiosulfatibacter sp.]